MREREERIAMPASFALSDEVERQLRLFVDLLLRWNATVNLVAARDSETVWDRHVADSLQLMPLLHPATARGVDLGSGAGFPGLVLALAAGIPFDLIESDRRKAAFLRTAAQETAAPVTVHACRIEDAQVAPAPLVTARALAPLPRLLALAAPFLAPGGMCLFLKGRGVEAELTEAGTQWRIQVERSASTTAPDGVVLTITGIARRTEP